MRVGYLMNTYPLTSTTFIRREMESLEALGLEIKRYAVRNWAEKLVDPLDGELNVTLSNVLKLAILVQAVVFTVFLALTRQ